MIRIVTQILIGLMLFFGVVTFYPRLMYSIRTRNVSKSLYFLLLWSVFVFFSVAAFYYAFLEIAQKLQA